MIQIFTTVGTLRFVTRVSPDYKTIQIRGSNDWYLVEGFVKAWRIFPGGKWIETSTDFGTKYFSPSLTDAGERI